MTTTPDTREGLLRERQMQAIYDAHMASLGQSLPTPLPKSRTDLRTLYGAMLDNLAALSPVDGEAKMPAWIRDYEPKSADPLLRRGDGEAKMREALLWIHGMALVRSQDDSKTFARVNRGALRTIADRAAEALASTQVAGGGE